MIHLLPGQSVEAQIRSAYTSSSSLVRVCHQLVLQVNETAGEDCYFGSADRNAVGRWWLLPALLLPLSQSYSK